MEKRDNEQTLVLIKPDALKNSATGYILSQISEFHTGLHFSGVKIVHVSRMLAEEHYAGLSGKVFYQSLLDYITGKLHYVENPELRRVIAIVYQGPGAIKKVREVAGPTNPHVARQDKPGCIRALGTVVSLRDSDGNIIGEHIDNLIHASDSEEDTEREIKLWFKPDDLPPSMHTYETEICMEYYFYKDEQLFTEYEPGSICFLAPGNVAWKSDLEILQDLNKGEDPSGTLKSVVAKYLLNNQYSD